MPTLAEQLIKSLRAVGVKYVFGIPGGPSIPYLEAMRNNGIEFVLVANEQSAAIMADISGRLTGIPGICHATFGPGATNLSTGIGGALLDRSPVIAFTTEVKAADMGRRVQMNIDHQALYKPITKWTARLTKDSFADTLTAAFRIAAAETPGPVHIGLPADIDGDVLASASLVDSYEKAPIPAPASSQLFAAAGLLKKAQKPLLAIGLTALRHGLSPLLRQFVDKNNIPFVVTPMAKGIIDDSHPCCAGTLFHAKSDFVAAIYRNADLIVGIGYDSVEFNYESWMPTVSLVHIDTEPVDITADYPDVCQVTGNPADALAFLNSVELPQYTWSLKHIKENKIAMLRALTPSGSTFSPADLITVIQEAMPQDGLITCDVGAHLHLLGQLWQATEPGRFIITNGWSAMGFGIPAAIGAKLCRPASAVVCLTGDGGFLMNCGELLTARRLGVNVIIVVLCDRNLSLIEVKQNWKKLAPYGTDLYQGEYFDADMFLGVPILKVQTRAEMRDALPKALSLSGPVIIEALVDGSIYQDVITKVYK